MKTITREYKVFNFDELSKEAKQKAIDQYYDYEMQYGYHFLEDDISEELKQIDDCFSDVKLQYSLSYCQGDGLSFSGELDLKKFLETKYSKKLPQYKIWGLDEYVYSVHSKGNSGHYCYASKNDIDYTENYQDYIERKHIDNLWQDVLTEIQEYYLDLCEKLKKYGYDILEYRMTDDEFSEFCESNDYKFFEDGKMFNL